MEEEQTPEIPDPLTDGDPEHLRDSGKLAEEFLPFIRRGLFLLRILLETAPRPSDDTFANDFAAIACFARVYRQLRAATLLAAFGYYSEVPTVLRGVYEACALGRYLAKEPDKAERWLKQATWIPDRDVRKWFGDEDRAYATWYRFYSERAHPTAKSCLPVLELAEDGLAFTIPFRTRLIEESLQDSLLEIAWSTMWACFALKNAAAREHAFPPAWREELANLANELGKLFEEKTGHPVDFSHLDRDWEKEDERWRDFLDRLTPASELDRILDEHPRSVRNIPP